MSEVKSYIVERPFYFCVVLWGERFREYFLEYCLPSLLAPGNIPSVATRQPSKFLVATRPDDWAAMRTTAIFKRLESHIEPVYVEIPPCPPGRSGCEHMSIGHKLASEISHSNKAYTVFTYPDSMLSDGAIARVQALAREGKQLVVCTLLRSGEEPLLENLRSRNLIPSESRRDSGNALVLPARDLAWAAINGLHHETLSFNWEAPYFVVRPTGMWWRVPNEDGLVLHCFNWPPLLLDFAAVEKLDTSTLDHWTIDGDFLYRNIGDSRSIYAIDDSDEAFLTSWAPLTEKLESIRQISFLKSEVMRDLIHAAQTRRTYYGPYNDPLRCRLFRRTVRWHSRAVTEAWKPVELKAAQALAGCIDELSDQRAAPVRRLLVLVATSMMAAFEPLILAMMHWDAVRKRLAQILHGNPDAWRRTLWHVDRVRHELLGRAFNTPPPKPPT
jgi:hypothetical protein